MTRHVSEVSGVEQDHIKEAMRQRLMLTVRPVVIEGTEGPEVGTGQVIRLDGRYFLVTAGHNLVDWDVRERAPANRVALINPYEEVDLGEVEWLSGPHFWSCGFGFREADGREFELPIDVGIVEMSRSEVEASGADVVDEVMLGPAASLPQTTIVVFGYPAEFYTRREDSGRRYGSPHSMFLMTNTPSADAWAVNGWDSRAHCLAIWKQGHPIEMVDRNGRFTKMAKLPHPGGISGSAMWVPVARPDGIFDASSSLRFVGIEYAVKGDIVVGATAGLMLITLGMAFPEMRGAIRRLGYHPRVPPGQDWVPRKPPPK